MKKKLFSILMVFAILMSISTITYDDTYNVTAEEVGDVWHEYGVEYTVVEVLPVVWETNKDAIQLQQVIDVTVTVSLGYLGNGKLHCIVRASSPTLC